MTGRDDRLPPDTATNQGGASTVSHGSGFGRFILLLLIIIIAVAAAALALGLVRIDSIGSLQPPHVAIEGGQIPKIEVNTAKIDMHRKTVTITVPEMTVEKPEQAPASDK